MEYAKSIRKMRDFYALKPDEPIYQEEFGYYCMDRWKREGHVSDGTDLDALFLYDAKAKFYLGQLGWTEAELLPAYEEKVLEDRGEYELVRDFAGRSVLFFKGRRNGFMPEYVGHPVKDMNSWEDDVRWRLDPDAPARYASLPERMKEAAEAAAKGMVICQNIIGGYMYLRSLIGPEALLYMFYDDPALIHACMQTWFELADRVSAEHQKFVTFDEVFFGEDICYNHGPLISPDMIREFLFPYYGQLLDNIRGRQSDKSRHLFFQLDTDGRSTAVIDLYREIGMDYMSPFEAASGCDVVAVRKKYPDLLIRGGFDKRILAQGRDAIDREIDRIMPFMKRHGGYIPTCDHGVPEEVSFEDYMHYRMRMQEFN